MTKGSFELIVIRQSASCAKYEDVIDNLFESGREVAGLGPDRQGPGPRLTAHEVTESELIDIGSFRRHDLNDSGAIVLFIDRLFEDRSISHTINVIHIYT